MRRKDREITDTNVMTDILQRAEVCYLALIDGIEPYVVALNYGFAWDADALVLYFHCAKEGKKLDMIAKNPAASFMLDTDRMLVGGEQDCDWGMNFSSVAGQGIIEVVTDGAERKRGLDLLMAHYTGRTEFSYDEKVFLMTTMLKMTVAVPTCKKKC